jgi:thioredoxin reductase
VVRAVPLSPGFRVHVADGRAAGARHLLIASGVRDDLPDVPGIAERWGRDVLHCPYCHGYEVRDQVLVVLGTCGHDAEKALLMRQWSRDVTLVLEDPGCVDASDLERLSARGIEVVRGRITELVLHDDALAKVRLADGRSLPAQALVLNPEVRGNDELVRALGASGGDVVRTDECGRTGVPGLWAVGSVGDPVEQVVDAMSAGNRTAIALNHELVMSDADDAVSAARRG